MSEVKPTETVKSYCICTLDSDYNEDWTRVDTHHDLGSMDEDQLRECLGNKVIIGLDDRIFVDCIDSMERVTI